jgi:SEC-C motif-containing protein
LKRAEERCRCHSGKLYKECCLPYHEGKAFPDSALILMRSRYCAYANGLPDYIMKTTHPHFSAYQKDKIRWRESIASFSKDTEFIGLKILENEEKGEEAYVKFRAELLQQGTDVSFIERSRFHRVNGCWLYVDGVITKPLR